MPQIVNIIIIVCAVGALAWGAWKGFTVQVAGFVGLILGIWLAAIFATPVVSWIDRLFGGVSQLGIVRIVVYVLLVILVILICKLIGRGVEKIVKFAMLGAFNTILGALFSLFKVILILAVVACIINYSCESMEIGDLDQLRKSEGFRFLLNFADKVFPYLKSLFLCAAA